MGNTLTVSGLQVLTERGRTREINNSARSAQMRQQLTDEVFPSPGAWPDLLHDILLRFRVDAA